MKRCIFEYTTGLKKTIRSEDGKGFVADILKAFEIEQEITKMLKSADCNISKNEYSASLIDGIKRMYEVNSKL